MALTCSRNVAPAGQATAPLPLHQRYVVRRVAPPLPGVASGAVCAQVKYGRPSVPATLTARTLFASSVSLASPNTLRCSTREVCTSTPPPSLQNGSYVATGKRPSASYSTREYRFTASSEEGWNTNPLRLQFDAGAAQVVLCTRLPKSSSR